MTPYEVRLREENDELREEVRQLRALLVVERSIPSKWKLSASEEVIVRTLLPREMATKEQILSALYSHRPEGPPDPKIVDVLICRIRKKLDRHRVQISTIWGRGYAIDAATRAEILGNGDVRESVSEEVEF